MVTIIVDKNFKAIMEIDDRTFDRDGIFSVTIRTSGVEKRTSHYLVRETGIYKIE